MVDSHCHLADPAFAADVEAVIARATTAGLVGALCVIDAADTVEHAGAARASGLWPAVRFAAGVHPHKAGVFAGRAAASSDLTRRALADLPLARAVGEIGLDYHYDLAPRDVQREVFAVQAGLARELGLPVVIHTRDADADTLDILRAVGGGCLRGVFHCFSGDDVLARAALDLGFHVSFSGIVTFPKASAVHAAARVVPDDRLLVETDCPYLAPVPVRGRRNEPSWVTHVVARMADLRGTTAASVAVSTTANYDRLFEP